MVTSSFSQTKLALAPIRQQVVVRFSYNVSFTEGIFHPDNPLLAQTIAEGETEPKRAIAVVDGGLLSQWHGLLADIDRYAQSYRDRLLLCEDPIVVPGGEAIKSDPSWVERIYRAIEQGHLCRHSYILAIGGGAVLDTIGYAAATAHRGIRLIRIPTTVLAQNDSGVGVKNSINAFAKKNFIGTFAPPYAVINDCNFLTTLEDRDWRSGMAEAIKVALIKDAEFFHWIGDRAVALSDRQMEPMQELIYRCAQLHLHHIANSGDAFEMGSSRPLDFGHWSAHKLEQLTDRQLRHGEAVAIGIALDSTYSYLAGWLEQSAWEKIINVLKTLGFCLYIPELSEQLENLDHPRCLFRGLDEFREHLGGQLTLMLLEGIGQGLEVFAVDRALYVKAIALLAEKECREQ